MIKVLLIRGYCDLTGRIYWHNHIFSLSTCFYNCYSRDTSQALLDAFPSLRELNSESEARPAGVEERLSDVTGSLV